MALSAAMVATLANPANTQYIAVLVEITYGSTTYRLSTLPYASGNYVYDDLISSDIVVESRLDSPNSVGDFDILDNVRDDWRTVDFNGRQCVLKIGDTRQPYASFEVLSIQKIQHVMIRDAGRYTVQFDETDLPLEVPISSPVVNGVSTPQSYGTIYNAEPVLIDAPNLVYYVGHANTVSSLTVRDSGVLLYPGSGYTVDPAGYAGAPGTKFKLLVAPAGQITVDVEVSAMSPLYKAVRSILNAAGIYITEAEILARMYGFPWDYKTKLYVGKYLRNPSEHTAKSVIDDLLSEYGCVMRKGDDGLPEIHYLSYDNIGYITPAATIEPDWILEGSLEQVGYDDAYSKIEINYQPNQTRQESGLAGSVTAANRNLFAREYRLTDTALTSYTGAGSKGTLVKQMGAGESTDAVTHETYRLIRQYSVVRRHWRLSVVSGLALMVRAGQVVIINDALLPSNAYHAAGRFFVAGVKHNYSTLISELEVIEA